MYGLSIVAVVKDEARYIEEWVAFHEVVGVEHFYLYDNGSTDGTYEKLERMNEDLVTLVRWPGKSQQLDAYRDALPRIDSRWCAFIDADEFLYSPRFLPLPTVLADYEPYPAVGAAWAVYGTSGFIDPPPSVVGSYFQRACRDHPMNRHVKSIVQPALVPHTRPLDPHHFGDDGVDEMGRSLDGPLTRATSWLFLRVNHYYAKSRAEAMEKSRKPRADVGELRPVGTMLGSDLNVVTDTEIHAYAPLVERRMEML